MTTTGYLGKSVNREGESVAQQATSEREAMWGPMPGEIVEFDPVTQKAIIQPLYKPKFDDGEGNFVEMELSPLEEVMVHFDHGLKGGLTYPVQPGDRVALVSQMRDTELYHLNNDFVAKTARSFSLSDFEAYYEGGLSLSDPIPNFSDMATNWRYDEQGMFGWFGSDDGRTKCVLAPGELIDTISEFCESHASGGSLSGNIQLLDILIDKTSNLIDAYKEHKSQSEQMQSTCNQDAAGWTALAAEPTLTSASTYTASATKATTMASAHGQYAAAYQGIITQLETRLTELQENHADFAALSQKFRAMELRD